MPRKLRGHLKASASIFVSVVLPAPILPAILISCGTIRPESKIAAIQPACKRINCLIKNRMQQLRIQLAQARQHKRTQVHLRMRNGKRITVYYLVAEQQQVKSMVLDAHFSSLLRPRAFSMRMSADEVLQPKAMFVFPRRNSNTSAVPRRPMVWFRQWLKHARPKHPAFHAAIERPCRYSFSGRQDCCPNRCMRLCPLI